MAGSSNSTHDLDLDRASRTLLDLTAEAMVVLDARARIVLANRAFREACGTEPEGLDLLDLVAPAARSYVEPELLQFLNSSEASLQLQLQLAMTTNALELRIERRAGDPDVLYGLARVVTHHRYSDAGGMLLEQKLRALHDSERFLIVVSELDSSRLLDVNRGFERVYNVRAEDVLGKTAVELGILSAEQQGAHSAALLKIGSTSLDSLELHTPDGRTVRLLMHATVIDCQPPLVMSISTDVTDYIAAQERARETDQRFAAVFENLNDAMYFVDEKGRIFDVNAAACRQLGYTREELLTMTIRDMVAIEGFDMERSLANFFGKSLLRFESVHRNKNGEVHPVEVTLCSIPHAGASAVAAIARDLTEQRLYEAKILEANNRMQAILQTLPDLLFEIDESGVICDFHSYRTDLLTMPVEHFLGKKLPDLTSKDIGNTIMGAVHDAIANGLASGVQYKVRNERWYEMSAARCAVPAGRRPRAVALARDITERKQHEEELTRSNEELSRFTYTVSHDLKSPLVTIRSFAGMLRKDLAKGDAARVERDLGFIEKAATRMHELLDDLLSLSRVGRQSSPPVRLSLHDLAREACELVAGQIAQNGAHVEITSTKLWFVGERTRLLEVFQNLIDNAIKFAKPNEPAQVYIGVERNVEDPSQPLVFVRDHGIGIDPRFKHKLFGLFEKLQPEATGTGIGLALIKRIVELHGGRVWIESEGVGMGTTVRFSLPSMTLEEA